MTAATKAKGGASASASSMATLMYIDGNQNPWKDATRLPALPAGAEVETVIKGDAKVLCIAAASIIAKVTRDRIMRELDQQYPQWNLAQHKGYPTAQHQALIAKHGICDAHRRSFAPIKGTKLDDRAEPED